MMMILKFIQVPQIRGKMGCDSTTVRSQVRFPVGEGGRGECRTFFPPLYLQKKNRDSQWLAMSARKGHGTDDDHLQKKTTTTQEQKNQTNKGKKEKSNRVDARQIRVEFDV